MARDSRMANRADARSEGSVTALSVRVSPRWKASSNRAIGIATGTTDTSEGATVRVRNLYDDSVNEVRTVSSFRADRPATKVTKATSRRKLTQVESMGVTNNIGRDYS